MIHYKIGKYHPNDSMSDLICDNYAMLLVMSRFGIDLGFGEATIDEACQKSNIDSYTFLAVVNTLIATDKESSTIDYSKVSLTQIVRYLHNAHSYFLDYRMPDIRCNLVEALDSTNVISDAIVNYFDEYVAEVNKHMMYEENTLFPYIASILNNECQQQEYNVELFSKNHDHIESKLTELKNILIKYYTAKSTNELNNVLYDIFSCERDLSTHNTIEDLLLVPALKEYELSHHKLGKTHRK